MNMKVYFTGTLFRKDCMQKLKAEDYQKMIETFENQGAKVLTKNAIDVLYAIRNEHIKSTEANERDTNWLKECDIVFADITIPDFVIGCNLGYAESLGKKIYAVYEKGTNIYSETDTSIFDFIRQKKNVQLFAYKNIRDVLKKISDICRDFNN